MKQLHLNQIEVHFAGLPALQNVDLTLLPGQVTLLAGPNGAGKSTLIRVLLGLVRPSRGHLEIDGKVRAVDRSFKSTLGYLPEAVAFAENLSGRQILKFFAAAHGVRKARIQEVLALVGLEKAANRAVRGYSKGMRQRLGLGVAILHEPQLLILDEPTGGLDQEGLAILTKVLNEWKQKDRTVVLSSHDLSLLEQQSDRICLLKEGRVCAYGTPGSLREQADLPLSVDFRLNLDAPRLVDGFLLEVQGWERVQRLAREEDRLVVEILPTHLVELMDLKARNTDAVSSVRVREPGLHDVYEFYLRKAC